MDKINKTLLVTAIAVLYSSASLAAGNVPVSAEYKYTLISYQEDGFEGEKPVFWMGNDDRASNENVVVDEKAMDYASVHINSQPGNGVGPGVAPFFDSYGVFRTNSNPSSTTYVALGFVLDDFSVDESDTRSPSNSGLSYGFGVNKQSFNVEYMMSLDEENLEVSAIGLGFVSEF